MKISKLFHWLYCILMFLPFGLLIFNMFACWKSGNIIDFNEFVEMFNFVSFNGVGAIVYNIFDYLIVTLFGFSTGITDILINSLTYWSCVSLIWLVFDLIMYVPLLVHRWIDKGVIE